MEDMEKTEIAMRYATEWYVYHASQRAIVGALLISCVQQQGSHPRWAIIHQVEPVVPLPPRPVD